jgi:nucleotide-binding universal stress UspA family protein
MGAEARTTANNNINNRKIQMKKILIPIDGSECSLNAARYAVKLAKHENAQVFCIHVIESVPYYGYVGSQPAIERYYEDLVVKVQSWFGKVRDIAKNEGISEIKTKTFSNVKSITESIIDYAANNNMDLIVIGSRGRTGLKRFLMGSVANGVVQHAHCPVLLVR